jgi:hypothetical protein
LGKKILLVVEVLSQEGGDGFGTLLGLSSSEHDSENGSGFPAVTAPPEDMETVEYASDTDAATASRATQTTQPTSLSTQTSQEHIVVPPSGPSVCPDLFKYICEPISSYNLIPFRFEDIYFDEIYLNK